MGVNRLAIGCVLLAGASFWACGSNRAQPDPPPEGSAGAAATDDVSPAAEPPAGVPGWMTLADGRVHPDMEATAPVGFYVRGRVVTDAFVPEGDVLGGGELGADGHPGWMEFGDGSFHGAETGRPPFPPYVDGFRSPDGSFAPSTRTIRY